MALGSVALLASGNSSTANQASFVLSVNTGAGNGAIGRLAVAVFAVDNNQTTDGDEGAVTSVTDSTGSNTWAPYCVSEADT